MPFPPYPVSTSPPAWTHGACTLPEVGIKGILNFLARAKLVELSEDEKPATADRAAEPAPHTADAGPPDEPPSQMRSTPNDVATPPPVPAAASPEPLAGEEHAIPLADILKIHFDDSKLHQVAAKCGVFADTDIVNLVKSGIPATEIACSIADAIVLQSLSVLTRGSTLKSRVCLLGGPNTYLPFLIECWRKRIPETWDESGYDWP